MKYRTLEPNTCVSCGKKGYALGYACPEHRVQVDRMFAWQREQGRQQSRSILDVLKDDLALQETREDLAREEDA